MQPSSAGFSLPAQYSLPPRNQQHVSPTPPASPSPATAPPPPLPPPPTSPPPPPPPLTPSRPLSASSLSSSDATSSSRIPASSPRKRLFVKGKMSPARPPPSRRQDRPRQRQPQTQLLQTPPDPPPSIWTTLGHLLTPVRLLLAPIRVLLGPIWWHLLNTLLLLLLAAGLFWAVISYTRSIFSSVATSITTNATLIPLRVLATPACLLTNSMCSLSLLASNGTAQPIWKLFGGLPRNEVDVAAVSRELSREARHAKDIFESLTALGDGRMTAGIGHLRIQELGIAIQTGSTLEERFFIGQELLELAGIASDLTDQVVEINAMSVNVFSWLFWEFENIAQLLALPAPRRPTTEQLGARLDSLLNRLDLELDRLYNSVQGAIPLATRGKDKGWMLISQLAQVHSVLRDEKDRFPGWQRAVDISRRFFAGGDPSKLTRINRDLDITRGTISGIDETSTSLDRVRLDLMAFRTQVRTFKGSVMGLHLGASEEIGLGPEQEMSILMGVVGDLGAAVGRAKRRPSEPAGRAIEGE